MHFCYVALTGQKKNRMKPNNQNLVVLNCKCSQRRLGFLTQAVHQERTA